MASTVVACWEITSHPQAFLGNAEVMRLVREKEMEAPPIVSVRGEIIADGKCPAILPEGQLPVVMVNGALLSCCGKVFIPQFSKTMKGEFE